MPGTREIFVLISETMSELAASDLLTRLSSHMPEFTFQAERRPEFNLPYAVGCSTYERGQPISLMECRSPGGEPVILFQDPDLDRVNATLEMFNAGSGI